jgi:cyclophilin family peptidyl-prolyl cis-trans isomerase
MTDDRRRSASARRAAAATPAIPAFDLYHVLGVRRDATHQEIVEAAAALDARLRTAAARDRGGATARQKRLNVARYWLTDSGRRRTYDAAVARGAAGAAGAASGPVRGARVGRGSATRGSTVGSTSWLNRPLTWLGIAVVVVIVGFLALRPGGFGGVAAPGPSTNPSNVAVGPSGSAGGGIPAGCPTSQPPAAPAGQSQVATIATDKGSIEVTLVDDLSPIAVGNFVELASCGYYDGVVFHRVVPNFVIQGGDGQFGRTSTYASGKAGQGGPGYTIQDEPVKTQYSRGTVAMARTSAPNSVGSQFFIVLSDDARSSLATANTYQIIGSVTKGMDVVDAIAAAADAENPTDPVVMKSVTVAAAGPASAPPPGSAAPSSGTASPAPSAASASPGY